MLRACERKSCVAVEEGAPRSNANQKRDTHTKKKQKRQDRRTHAQSACCNSEKCETSLRRRRPPPSLSRHCVLLLVCFPLPIAAGASLSSSLHVCVCVCLCLRGRAADAESYSRPFPSPLPCAHFSTMSFTLRYRCCQRQCVFVSSLPWRPVRRSARQGGHQKGGSCMLVFCHLSHLGASGISEAGGEGGGEESGTAREGKERCNPKRE